jgi:hypothetical protein
VTLDDGFCLSRKNIKEKKNGGRFLPAKVIHRPPDEAPMGMSDLGQRVALHRLPVNPHVAELENSIPKEEGAR